MSFKFGKQNQENQQEGNNKILGLYSRTDVFFDIGEVYRKVPTIKGSIREGETKTIEVLKGRLNRRQ